MSWAAKDWLSWGRSVQAFFSAKGMIVKEFVVPSDMEGQFFMAAIENPDAFPEIDGMKDKLFGVKVRFTNRLSKTFLFRLEDA